MTATSWDKETAASRAVLDDLVQRPAPQHGEGCETVQMNLDLFVSDELDGLDVRLRHPHAWQHLQLCADCREDHDRLLDLLSAEAAGRLAALPPRPAVPPAVRGEPWRLEIVPAPGRDRPTLQFIFASSYLRQSLRPVAVAGVRAADEFSSDRLLLSYLGAPADSEVMVQLYAQPDASHPQTGSLTLALIAAGEPMPTAAELTWAGRTWTVALGQDGEAIIGPVSAADLPEEGRGTPTPTVAAAFSLRLLF